MEKILTMLEGTEVTRTHMAMVIDGTNIGSESVMEINGKVRNWVADVIFTKDSYKEKCQ